MILMVVQGDFTVTLVHADTRQPFQEHARDGKVYVEVEPDAEYFISVQRTGSAVAPDQHLLVVCYVDGQALGYQAGYNRGKTYEKMLMGLYSRANGTSSMKALRFEKPRVSSAAARATVAAGNGQALPVLGKVEIKVFEGFFLGVEDAPEFETSTLTTASIDPSQGKLLGKKKGLRTGPGSTVVTAKQHDKVDRFSPGTLVDTIALNYCAAAGLIEAGVLSSPARNRKRGSHEGGSENGRARKSSGVAAVVKKEKPELPAPKKVRDAATGRDVEVYELLDGSDDDEG